MTSLTQERLAGRAAAAFFFGAGVVTLANSFAFTASGAEGVNVRAFQICGALSLASGLCVWWLPPARLHRVARLGLAAWGLVLLEAMAVVANYAVTSQAEIVVPVFMMVILVWLGLTSARGVAAAFAPVTIAACAYLAVAVPRSRVGFAGPTLVILISTVVAETIAWAMCELRRREDLLAVQASTDPLTGLLNRTAFREQLEESCAKHEHLMLAFADLNNFKYVNDSFGHHVGDDVLVEFAERLQRVARDRDVVARFGGDEFVVLFRATRADVGADALLERIRTVVAEPWPMIAPSTVTASVGIVDDRDGSRSPAELLREADSAMYARKHGTVSADSPGMMTSRALVHHRAAMDGLGGSFTTLRMVVDGEHHDWLIVEANARVRDIYSPVCGDPVGKLLSQLDDVADNSASRPIYAAALESNSRHEADIELQMPGGVRVWRRLLVVPVDVDVVAVMTWDISAEKATEQALRDSDERSFAIVERAADAIMTVDEHGLVGSFNRAAEVMFEIGRDDAIGRSYTPFVPDQSLVILREAFASQRPGERIDVNLTRASGEDFHAQAAIATVETSVGAVSTAIVRDVTEQKNAEEALRASTRRFHALVQHALDGIIIGDTSGRVLYASPFAEQILGVSDGGLVGVLGSDRLHPDDYRAVKPLLERARANPGMSVRYEARIRTGARGWVWVDATVTNLLHDADVGGVVVNFRDISERKAADAQREAVADLGRRVLAGMPLGQLSHAAAEFVVDLLGADSAVVLEHVDRDAEELVVRACVGWPQDSVGHAVPAPAGSPPGRTLAKGTAVVVADYQQEPPFPTKELILAAGVRSSIGVAIGGHDRPWGLLGALSVNANQFTPTAADFVQAIANVLGSAIERQRSEEELSRQALHDPLTGLPNRALLVDRIELGLAGARRSPDTSLVVQFIDLDNFKRINDTLGYDVGDELLRHVARRLQAVVREEDTVARCGGDEFVVVTRLDQRLESPLVLAQRLVTELREAFDIRAHHLFVTASVGIAISTHHHDNAKTLLRDADAAMYQAKDQGRDRYAIFDGNVRALLVKRLSTETDLRSALDRDELRVYYQPIVDSRTGQTVGLEALVRWAHPQRGLVSPDEFISVAEDTGLILPIGRWVLRTACEQLARWQHDLDRPDLVVSVNLSPRQLTDPGFVAILEDTLASTGITPRSLRLEITESMLVEDVSRATGMLKAITDLNVGLVIDDFGTGYSSLSYIKKLPICCLKIDRSFITDICHDTADRAIVAAVTALAHQMGIHAVAEGVETAEQLAVLRTVGCTLIQGYHYTPALPAADLDTWLSHEPHQRATGLPLVG